MAMFYGLVALCLSGSALAQVARPGACPYVQVQQNFNTLKFCGRWFESAGFMDYEFPTKCEIFDYIPRGNNTIKLINTFNSAITGQAYNFETDMYTPDHKQPAKMLMKIPLSPIDGYNNIRVLGTDYDNYAVVYSCNDACSLNVQYAWILTRERIPDESVLAKAYEVMDKNNIKKSYLLKIDQKSCRKQLTA